MKPQKQTILHDPDNGKFGNCFSAVLASLLHIDINEIPVFKEKETWKKEVNKFLRPYNLAFFDFMDYPEAAEFGGVVGLYHEQAGNTVRGKECSHATVAIDGKVVFDPHPNGDGLAEVYDYSGVFVCLEPWQLIEAKREIESLRQQLAACKAALSEPETVTLPDGWVAVPVEPTEKMMNIYKDYHDRGEAYKDITIYKSMLQAAPTLNEKG